MLAELDLPTTTTTRRTCDRDRRLACAARHALRTSGYRAVAQVKCEVLDGVVILSGFVSSFYLKQIAQSVILRMNLAVENLLEVRDTEDDR